MSNVIELTADEMMDINGGILPLIITGAMVVKGLTCLTGGIAVGYAVGTIIKNW